MGWLSKNTLTFGKKDTELSTFTLKLEKKYYFSSK